MPTPILPEDFRSTIPGPTGNFCEKFLRVLQLPRIFASWYSYVHRPDGEWTEEWIADICATQCVGDGTGTTPVPPGGLAAPTGLMATDGAFSDRVQLAWVSVVTAEGYDIYRSLTNDSSTATLLASVLQTTMYTDTGVDQGQVYWYWVKAKKAAIVSAFSAPDSGYSAGTLTAVTDLRASRGFYTAIITAPTTADGSVALVFTAATGANAYDIYRGTVDDFSATTTAKVDSDRMPFDTARNSFTCAPRPCTKPLFIDNGGHLVYYDKPPSPVTKYYYWVVAKQVSGSVVASVSGASNSAYGWVVIDSSLGGGFILGWNVVSQGGAGFPVPVGMTRAWIVLIGPGGGGAGGNDGFGGGGGGGAAIIAGKFTMTAGANRFFKYVATRGLGGAASTNGGDSSAGSLQYDPGTGVFTTIIETAVAAKGSWNALGGGAGGAPSAGYVVNGTNLTNVETEPGFAGEAAAAVFGGRGGCSFGVKRGSPHNFPNVPSLEDGAPTIGGSGGSDATPGAPGSADGDNGQIGQLIIAYF